MSNPARERINFLLFLLRKQKSGANVAW